LFDETEEKKVDQKQKPERSRRKYTRGLVLGIPPSETGVEALASLAQTESQRLCTGRKEHWEEIKKTLESETSERKDVEESKPKEKLMPREQFRGFKSHRTHEFDY
jgi:hypothetical protein